MLNLFPEVGFAELFKLFLEVEPIKLTNVFSSGHESSFGEYPIHIISLSFPVVGDVSPSVSYTHLTLPTNREV